MVLTQLTKVDGGGISTTSDYRVGVITATKFVGPFDGSGGNFSGVVTATNGVFSGNISAVDGNFSGNVTIGGTLTYEDVTNIDSVGIVTAAKDIHVGAGVSAVGVGTFGSLDIGGDIDVDGHTNLDNVSIAGVTTFTGITTAGISYATDFKAPDGNTNGFYAGNSDDLHLFHNGADSHIENSTGNLTLTNKNNNNIIFKTTSSQTERFRIRGNDGFIGINTTTPTKLVTIKADAPFLRLEAKDTSDKRLDLQVSSAGIATISAEQSSQQLSFKTTGGEAIRITSDGKVGINQSSPNAMLQVDYDEGNSEVGLRLRAYNASGSKTWQLSEINGNVGVFTIRNATNSVNALNITGDGKIGIGVDTSLTDILTVNDTNPKISMRDGGTERAFLQVDGSDDFIINNKSISNLIFKTQDSERLRIDSSGNVTLGTASAAGNKLYFQSTSGAAQYIASGGSNNRNLIIGSSAGQFVNITSAGDVGIGYDSPTVKLHVREAASGASSYDNRYHVIIEDDAEAYLGFYVPDNGYAGIRFTDASGQAGYIDYYFGNDEMHYAAISKHIFKVANVERLRIDPAGNLVLKDHLAQGNSLVNYIQANDVNGNAQYILGQVSTGNQDLYLQQTKNANLRFQTNASTRWKIDGDPGHLLPEVAGAVDIGSTSAEIGNVYLADLKHIYFGNEQDLDMRFDGSNAAITLDTGTLSIINYANNEDVKILSDNGSGGVTNYIEANGSTGETRLYNYGNRKLTTTTTGITVTGEVAASQDYPSLKPTLDLNFAGDANLDPRITFTRLGASASYVGRDGLIKFAAQNEPRFDHDPVTRECKGLLIEEQRQNIHPYSERLDKWTVETGGSVTANTHISPAGDLTADSVNGTQSGSSAYTTFPLTNGSTYTFSFFMKYVSGNQNILISIGDAALTRSNTTFNTSTGALVSNSGGTATVNDVVAFPNGWYRYSITRTATSSSSAFIDFNHTSSTASVVAVWGAQVELGAFTTSYIRTDHNLKPIRGADECYIDGQDFLDFYNQLEGTMISSHSILPNIPSTHNLYTYQISPTGATAYAPLRLLDKNGSYGNSLTAASVYNNSTVFLVQPSGSPVTVAGKKMLTAASIKKDDYNASFNGEDTQSDNSGDLYTADHLSIGYYKPVPQAYLNGHIQRLTYYPFKLTDNQLKTVTS